MFLLFLILLQFHLFYSSIIYTPLRSLNMSIKPTLNITIPIYIYINSHKKDDVIPSLFYDLLDQDFLEEYERDSEL